MTLRKLTMRSDARDTIGKEIHFCMLLFCVNRIVFLDIKKAFDTVGQKILIKKLEFYGIKK